MKSPMVLVGILFGVEFALILAGLAVWFFIRRKRAGNSDDQAEGQVSDTGTGDETVSSDEAVVENKVAGNWLEDEIKWTQTELEQIASSKVGSDEGEEPAPGPDASGWVSALRSRLFVLESEMRAREASGDDEAVSGILQACYSNLSTEDSGSLAGADAGVAGAEIQNLKGIIDTQQSLVDEMRDQISAMDADPVEKEILSTRIESAKEQTQALLRCVGVLENAQNGLTVATDPDSEGGDDTEIAGIRTLIGDQQETIDKLRGMLADRKDETSPDNNFSEMIARISDANSELGNCIVTLESDNAELRARLESEETETETDLDGAELEALRDKVAYLEQQIASRDAEIGELKAENMADSDSEVAEEAGQVEQAS